MPDVGSLAGSLRVRNSIGSIASCSASSSTVHSRAKVPIDSPGARMKVFGTMSISATCCTILKLPAAYRCRAGKVNCSGQLLWAVIAAVPVCISASKWPSAVAPIATRCSVVVRPPMVRYTPSRESTKRTGRPESLAAAAARTWCCHSVLPPNAPPTYGEDT